MCIPGVFRIQAYIITVSSARFPPEYAEQKKKKKKYKRSGAVREKRRKKMRNRMSSTPPGLQTEAFARAVLQTTANVSFHDTKKKSQRAAAGSGSAARNTQDASSL